MKINIRRWGIWLTIAGLACGLAWAETEALDQEPVYPDEIEVAIPGDPSIASKEETVAPPPTLVQLPNPTPVQVPVQPIPTPMPISPISQTPVLLLPKTPTSYSPPPTPFVYTPPPTLPSLSQELKSKQDRERMEAQQRLKEQQERLELERIDADRQRFWSQQNLSGPVPRILVGTYLNRKDRQPQTGKVKFVRNRKYQIEARCPGHDFSRNGSEVLFVLNAINGLEYFELNGVAVGQEVSVPWEYDSATRTYVARATAHMATMTSLFTTDSIVVWSEGLQDGRLEFEVLPSYE